MITDKQFLIILPAYNEVNNISNVLEELLSIPFKADILVVNDGSIDGTEDIASTYPVKVISHPCNLGYGAALQTGYRYAFLKGYEYCLQFDADGQHNPTDLNRMADAFNQQTADIIIGSRFLNKSKSSPIPWKKKIAISFFRTIIFRLTGMKITDPTSGFKGFSRKVFTFYSQQGQYPADFPDADILIHMLLNNFRIKEIPVTMREREFGESMHSGWKPFYYMTKIMLSILLVLLRHRLTKKGRS